MLDDGRRRERLAAADGSEGDTVSVARNEKEGERRRRQALDLSLVGDGEREGLGGVKELVGEGG